jgi:hypothetical protein
MIHEVSPGTQASKVSSFSCQVKITAAGRIRVL